MKNIPTDLLRALIAVVDLRSFTRAAEVQGLTQPAVSAQIKRLQSLVGSELLDKSAPGISLTRYGEVVVSSARRMLSINDHILTISRHGPIAKTVRVGIPGDCMGDDLTRVLVGIRKRWPRMHLIVAGGSYPVLSQGLKEGKFDIVLAPVTDDPANEARHSWREPLAWVRSERTVLDPDAPVPLVSYSDSCVYHRVGVSSLNKAGRRSELVFRATAAEALRSAVAGGVGVMVVPRSRVPADLIEWDDGPLPPLTDVHCGIFLGEDCKDETVIQLADQMAAVMRRDIVAAKVA